MEDQRKKTLSVLEDLIEINNDGNEGYKTAADDIDNPAYKTLFYSYAQQRATFAAELKREAELLGRDPDSDESFLGAIHRGWINIKSAFTSGGSEAILAECETGDKAALETYEEVLAEPLPANIESLVRAQHQSILEAYTKIKTFKNVSAQS
ncbi:MAG: PA2169 family four-helix-bundle protein [Bacteroidota bacterium]